MLKPVNNASFSPVPGNLDTFLSSVQQVHVPEEPEQPEVPAEDPEEPLDFGGEDSDDSERKTVPTNTGKALARLVDRGWAFGAGLYAHAPSEKYRSTQAEIGELEDAFADFVEETGINISPPAASLCPSGARQPKSILDSLKPRRYRYSRSRDARDIGWRISR